MTDGSALLRAIEASPEEDTPRLAYADWLDEHGTSDADRGRAAFIRLQCARARPDGDLDPTQKEASLRAKYEKVWVNQFPGQIFEPTFRRGFLDPVWTGGFNVVRHWEAYLAVAPLHHVRLFKTPVMTDQIAACPAMKCVRRLDLTSNVVRNAHIAALIASPHLVKLTVLDARHNHIGVAGCQAMAEAELPALRTLILLNNPIKDKGLAALFGAKWTTRLARLDVSRCGLTERGLQELAAAPLPGLEALQLNHEQIVAMNPRAGFNAAMTERFIVRLAANPSLTGLRYLGFFPGHLTDTAARAILDSPSLKNLTGASVATNLLSSAVKEQLARRIKIGAVILTVTTGW
jgi:uncharacterized protein (TIGR02996 family)